MAEADARGDIDWTVSVDSTITRAHQHGTNTTRPDQPTGGPERITRIWSPASLTGTESAGHAAG